MPKTPDRSPGVSDEEGVVLEDTISATQQGEIRYSGSSFSFYDGTGEYDPRSGADNKDVKVSSNDTTADFLDTKLVAGTNVTLTEQNDGGNETLEISASGAGVPTPTEVGQILYCYNGTTFEVVKPVVTNDGFVVTDQDGHIVVVE